MPGAFKYGSFTEIGQHVVSITSAPLEPKGLVTLLFRFREAVSCNCEKLLITASAASYTRRWGGGKRGGSLVVKVTFQILYKE